MIDVGKRELPPFRIDNFCQVAGGVGVAIGLSVAALLTADMVSVGVSGLAGSAAVLGAALLAVPATRIVRRHGRGPSLSAAYLIAALGGSLIVTAATIRVIPLLFTGLFLFMFTCLGLGLLISLVSRTRHQAQQAVMFLMIPTMVLSGFIFPIQSMPAVIQPLTNLIPLTWALQVLRGAFVKGSGFEALAVPMLALVVFGVVIFGAAIVATRRRISE